MGSNDQSDNDLAGRRRETEAASAASAPAASASVSANSGATEAPTGGTRESAAAEKSAAAAQIDGVLFDAETSALYHKAREGFFDAMHRLVMAGILLSSSYAVVVISAANVPKTEAFLAAIPAILGSLDIVFAFGMRAREHAVLGRRFMELSCDTATDRYDARDLMGRFYALCGEEPPTYQVVHSLCHNQSCDVRERPDYKVRTTRLQRWFRHFYRFEGAEFPRVVVA